MVLTDVGSTKMAEERQTSSTDSVGQKRLSSARPDLVVGDKVRPVDMEDASKAPIVQRVYLLRQRGGHRPYLGAVQKYRKNANIV